MEKEEPVTIRRRRYKLVRDIARKRFPGLKGVLVKRKDKEGDLVTITTTDEKASFRLYITEVIPIKNLLMMEQQSMGKRWRIR
ncbi:hypothetical protein DEO72_LG7g2017 [Vigna unguiculata]|uniref:Uncharacterized protein n=1 Tax=Vigna unguiculata TaxID=3917 RepID=A0A4D6ML44_VIGUN|nr:hypothetical protein DEO72_LG7g2017 [Vigna unguiculata]